MLCPPFFFFLPLIFSVLFFSFPYFFAAERLQESRLPSLLPRYKATIQSINKFQLSTKRLFRATTEQQFDPTPSVHQPSEEEVLQKYISRLGDLRVQVLENKQEYENAFLRNDVLPTHLKMDDALQRATTMYEHASMIGASDPINLGALSDFVMVLTNDVTNIIKEIQQIQQSAEEV